MDRNPDRCPGCRSTDIKYLDYMHKWVWYFPAMDEDDSPPQVDFCPHCGMELYAADEMETTQ